MTNPADMMPFSNLMGVKVSEASKDKIVGTLIVRDDLCTAGGILHGGAMMAFADALGGIGAYLSLPSGKTRTTTVESKTNFLGATPAGQTVTGECTPIKIGKTLSIWQTRITREDGKLVGIVTQTQMAL